LKENYIIAGVVIGLAATIKFLPAVIAGPLLFFLKPKQAIKLFLGASLSWITIYLVMFGLGYKPLGLLPTFFEKWRGGAPIYPILEQIKNALHLSGPAFVAMLGILAILGFGLSARLAAKRHIYAALILALAIPLLLSPVLFPWYLMSLLPLLALRPNLTLISALFIAPTSYVVLDQWLANRVWEPAIWPSFLLAIAIAFGLSIDIWLSKQKPPIELHKYLSLY